MRRNPGATAALLQKAGSQLRGEKIEKPEDELNAYISSLTQKTVKSQKSVNFEDLGDSISISSDIDDSPVKPVEAVTSSGSKFLKKKTSVDEPDASAGLSGGNKFLKKPQASTASPVVAATPKPRYGVQSVASSGGSTRLGSQIGTGRQVSSALDKASALTGKIQHRAATRKTYTLESDSDESFSAVRISGSGDQISDSQTDSVKIGRDGGKFLKKATPTPSATLATVPVASRSIEPPIYSQTSKGKQPAQEKLTSPQKKASPFTLKSSLKYSTDVVLTSEEESLAEFVGGLPSSSDSLEKPRAGNQYKRTSGRHTLSPTPKVIKSGKSDKNRSPSPTNKPPMIRRTPSPSPRSPGLRRRSPSPKLRRSYSDDSNVADSIQDEVAEEFDIGMNEESVTLYDSPHKKKKVVIMDLDDLGPADDLPDIPSRSETPRSRSDSPVRSTARKSTKSPGKSSLKKDSKKDSESPFRASKSPFRASEGNESPFKASSSKGQSLFKASDKDSLFKSSKKENKSPFKKSGNNNDSPFRASNEGSFFKSSTKDSSPFRASNEGSLFKASTKESSPFKSSSSKKADRDRSSSPFKAPPIRSPSPYTDRSDSRSRGKKKRKKNKKSQKKTDKSKKDKNSKPKNDIFSAFGIQTVEDLLGQQSISVKETQSEIDDVPSQIEELPSEVSEEIKTEKVYSRQSSFRYDDSATEVVSEIDETKPSVPTYTDEFDSISEKIGYISDHGGRSSASEVRTKYSGEETVASYTEYSESETDTETYTRSRSEEYEDSYSYTPSYTEDFTRSVVPTKSDVTPRPKRGMVSTEVQTALDGLYYSWDPAGSGMAYPGTPYGLHFMDPTPIASHVVSADALEAMTAYSPAMLALHDMLKSQLELTREFLDMQTRMHAEASTNIQPRYQYTTLEDTKKYIKKHKKKKLTFKEALQLVDLEMARR